MLQAGGLAWYPSQKASYIWFETWDQSLVRETDQIEVLSWLGKENYQAWNQ